MPQRSSQVRVRERVRGKKTPSTALTARRALLPLARVIAALAAATLTAGLHAVLSLGPWDLFVLVFVLTLAVAAWRTRSRETDGLRSVHSFGQYTILRKLGEGGMGVVYEARHALLPRPMALKLLRQEQSRDSKAEHETVRRFEREAQLTSQLSHPNTIVIYDYGRNEDGVLYYAMEYVDGVDLDRLVRVDGPLAPAHAIHLALQVCGSLTEAHAHGLVHGAIKPSNLLVYERAGVTDTIKVLDFGLAKSLRGPAAAAADVLMGTPLYTAPELLTDPAPAGPRSDIYALGAVLHWLCTGKTLQEAYGDTSPSPSVPVDLGRVIVRCTETSPNERPESMDALASELMQCPDYGQWTLSASRAYWDEREKRLSRVLAQPAASGADALGAS